MLQSNEEINYDRKLKIWIKEEEKKELKNKLEVIGINLKETIFCFGITSRRDYRIWPMEYYVGLMDYLIEKYNIQVIYFCIFYST